MEATEPGPGCALSAGRGGMVTFHDRARYERFIGFRTEPRSHNWRENIEPLYRIRSSADNFPTNCAYGEPTENRFLSLSRTPDPFFAQKCRPRDDRCSHTSSQKNKPSILHRPYGDDFQERLAAHWAKLE
jgi:hypothetical protein